LSEGVATLKKALTKGKILFGFQGVRHEEPERKQYRGFYETYHLDFGLMGEGKGSLLTLDPSR